MRVFVTGATGFVGQHVVRALLRAGHSPRCLVRRTQQPDPFEDDRVEIVHGDVLSPLKSYMSECEGVIHIVGIIREGPSKEITFQRLHTDATTHVAVEARKAGVGRMVYISANGASASGRTRYQTTKWAAEEAVRNSGLGHWCILRPGLIFGDPGSARDDFCSVLARQLIRPLPVIPIFGNGRYSFQPVHVGQVAEAATQALRSDAAGQKTIVAVGRDELTYVEVVDLITRALGLRPKPKVHIPVWLVDPLLRIGGNGLPITSDQLTMLLEGNCGDASEFFDTFTLTENGFTEAHLSYVRTRA